MAEKKFAIRFSVEDMEKVRAALKGMGNDGASALRALESSSRTATPQLRAVDTAAREIRQSFNSFADRIPVIGGALQALGPVGTAVAAGFAGITLGLNALSNASRQAVVEISALKDSADAVGLEVEDFQVLRGAGMMVGVNRDEMQAMLATLAANSARASEGFGRMKTALDRVNPELSRQMALTTSQAERMNILARATQEATDYNDKLNISIAAFGNSGGKMVAMLDEQGAAMDTWTERAMAAGIVLDKELVEAVDAMGDRLEVARARTEVAVQRLVVTMAPLEEWMEKFKGDTAQGFAFLFAGEPFKAVEDQSTAYLANEFNKTVARYKTMRDRGIPEGSDTFTGYEQRITKMSDELVRRYNMEAAEVAAAARKAAQEQLKADAESFGEWLNQWLVGEAQRDYADAEKLAAEAQRRAEEAARLRTQQDREAIEIRASLGDWTSKLAAEEARLNTLVAAGALSRQDADASLAKTRAELDGTAAAVERWKSMLESAETPIQKAERALAAFDAEVAKFGDLVGVNEDAVRAGLVGALEEAERAANMATPAMMAVVKAREAIARYAESKLTDDERVAAYTAEMYALADATQQTGFSHEEAARAIEAYRAELDKTKDAQKDATFEVRFAAETLGAILDDDMNSLEDFGKVAVRVFRNMAIEWILANQKMAASQGFLEFIGNAFAASFGGGGGAGAPAQSSPDASFGGGWGVYHTGGVIGSTPVASRWANSSIFAGAPRMHTGGELRAGERAIIAEDGERMLSRVDNARIVRAVEAGGGGGANVEVHFHGDMEAKPEVRQSRGADGGTRVDVYMRKAVADAIGGGAADGAMASRYGVKRAVGV